MSSSQWPIYLQDLFGARVGGVGLAQRSWSLFNRGSYFINHAGGVTRESGVPNTALPIYDVLCESHGRVRLRCASFWESPGTPPRQAAPVAL